MGKKIAMSTSLLTAAMIALLLGGCGSSKKEGAADPTSVATKIDNFNCTSTCHSATLSKVASAIPGASIPTDWIASKHNTSGAADCQDCHGGGSNHWGLGPIPTANPDEAKACLTCHGSMPAPHFNNITTGASYPASFVNSQDQGRCRICHNPHNPTTQMPINIQWAASGKGDVNALPWSNREFKTSGHNGNPAVSTASDCVRCHTTTGYINYVNSNFANVRAWGTTSDKTKETLQCNACHDKTYDFTSQRSVAAGTGITAFYNYSSRNTKKLLVHNTFPDKGKSNICLLCHVGRESGQTLAAVAALPATGASFVNYTSQAFINSHYLTGGATLFGVSGYEFPTLVYQGQGAHATVVEFGGDTVVQGPCVSCHMQRTTLINGVNKPAHLFKPEVTSGAGIDCAGCHAGVGVPIANEVQLEAQHDNYNAALLALKVMMQENAFRKMFWGSSNPYFFKDTNGNGKLDAAEIRSSNSQTKWQSVASPVVDNNQSGQRNLGAAFNYNLLAHDPGGFAHNARYVKQLIFDSIDWLDDNVLPLNGSVAAAINALTYANEINPATGVVFTAGEIAAQKAAAIAYLGGGVRP